MENDLRQAVFHDFRFWRHVADAVNPLLALALLILFFLLRRHDKSRARDFGWRALFSLVVAWAIVRDLRFYVFSHFDLRFPSGHLTFALCAALSFTLWKRRSAWILTPILISYAWLMTALRFHNWLDLAGAIPVALAAQSAVGFLLKRRAFAAKTEVARAV